MNLSPLPIQKFFDNNGRPLVGGLLFTYEAGTTTKLATYSDESGTLNTNPIVLNFRGEANVWLDQTLTYKFVLSPEGDTDPPTKPIWTVDNISAAVTFASLTRQILGQILWPQTTAEAAVPVTPTNYFYFTEVALDATRFGVTGDGSTDDTTALENWLLALGESTQKAVGFLPTGTYKFTSGLTIPANVLIYGAGYRRTILQPSSAVATAVTMGDNTILSQLQIDGTNTSGKTGLTLANTLAFNYVDNVWVQNFDGSGAIGVLVKDAVFGRANRLVSITNATNLKISSSSILSLPTTLTFDGCRFAESTVGPGVLLETGQLVTFVHTIIENNTQEGLVILPPSGGIAQDIIVDKCWFENNYAGNTAKYHIACGDGTSLGGAIIRPVIKHTFFNGDSSTCKSIDMNGSAVQFKIIDPRFPNGVVANTINIRNSAFGSIDNWPQEKTYSTLVADSTGTTGAASGVNTFTPTRNGFTEVLGGGTITASGRWTKNGRRVFWNIQIVAAGGATIASVANTSALTTTAMPVCTVIDTCTVVRSNDTANIGIGYMAGSGSTNTVGAPAWAALAGTYVFSGSYEILA